MKKAPTCKAICNVLKKYNMDLEVEISEMNDLEVKELMEDMESIGYKFNRTEPRYKTCVMAIFEKAEHEEEFSNQIKEWWLFEHDNGNPGSRGCSDYLIDAGTVEKELNNYKVHGCKVYEYRMMGTENDYVQFYS